MDSVSASLGEPVFMQIGTSSYRPQHADFEAFCDDARHELLLSNARLVVAHAGIGTLLKATRLRKPIICVPRMRRFRESWDDHQVEFCLELTRSGRVFCCYDEAEITAQLLERAFPPRIEGSYTDVAERITRFLRTE